MANIGDKITYKGDCDIIMVADGHRQLDKFHSGELIYGNQYRIVGAMGTPAVWVMKEGKPQIRSQERYLCYHRIKNEYGQEIFVWEGFFENKIRR